LGILAGGAALLTAPAWLALRGRTPTCTQEVETLDDAVDACRRSGLEGWDLVTFAQRLVCSKFAIYSCRNLWDSPAQAFRYGMGYCTQYNLALQQILQRLGIETQAVFSLRVAVLDEPEWSMGHTWLEVTVQNEPRTVCAGHADNLPGKVHFTPLAPVWRGNDLLFLLLHLGVILLCGVLEWRAVLVRRPLPDWMFHAQLLPPLRP
jgi:hypothetical protein